MVEQANKQILDIHINSCWEITKILKFHKIFLCSADGLYMIEVDRILRPGGYWILSGPPIRWAKYWRGWERTQADLKQEQDTIEDFAKRMCWTKVEERGDIAVWQKHAHIC